MRLIKPVNIKDPNLIYSSVAEPSAGETSWSAANGYSVGAVVTYVLGGYHRKYKRLIAGTTSTIPPDDSINWEDIGPTNRWAMFDDETNTQTASTGTISVTVDPGQNCNGLALIELVGSAVTISVRDAPGGPVVYTQSISLEQSLVLDWYQYFFEPYSQRGSVVLTDLPPYPTMRVEMTINGPGTVKVGGLIVGTLYSLGTTNYSATAGIRDYSKKDTNTDTGIVTLIPGKFSKRLRAKLQVRSGQVGSIQTLLTELRATPAVWIGDDTGTYEALTVFGFYRDFELDVAYPEVSFYSLDVEGMT